MKNSPLIKITSSTGFLNLVDSWAVTLVVLLLLTRLNAVAQLPSVYRGIVDVYASVPSPQSIIIGASGTMYVGNGDNTRPVKVHRIGPGGAPIEAFGNEEILDPDAVAVDESGAISGTPGSLLIGAGEAPESGSIKVISPDGLVSNLLTGLSSFQNPNALVFDKLGRLLALDGNSGAWGIVTRSNLTSLGTVGQIPGDLAVDASNRVCVSTISTDGNLWVFDSSGAFQQFFSVNAVSQSPLAASASWFWGTNIYAINADGQLISVDPTGVARTRGEGFQSVKNIYFGTDGNLYASETEKNRIIKISPDTGPNLQIKIASVELCWNSLLNHTYQVQYRSLLTTNQWLNLGTPIPGTDSEVCTKDLVDLAEKKFYRVQELP